MPPVNDNQADAIAIGSLPTSFSVDTTGATTEAGEPNPSGNMQATVWYTLTISALKNVTIDLLASSYDTELAVYEPDMTLVGFSSDYPGASNYQSKLTVELDAGIAYYVQIGGWRGATGTAVADITAEDPLVATHVSTKDVSVQDGNPYDVAFSPDGTKMFMMGFNNKTVYRYDLPTAWDITSASYVSLKDVSAQDTNPYGVTFSPDGGMMFVLGSSNDSVYRYDLSIAWDITSASYVSLKYVGAQDGAPFGVAFSPDGGMMFVVGDQSDSVYRYDLSTAWDITSASYVSFKDVLAQDPYPFGVAFSGDGTKMFVLGGGNDGVYRYDLTTAWDITSASYVSFKGAQAQSITQVGVTFSPDGTKMFVTSYGNASVYRYDMAPAPVTARWGAIHI